MIYHCVTKLGKYVSHGLQRITTFICSYYFYIVIISVGKMFSLVYREVSINGGVTMMFPYYTINHPFSATCNVRKPPYVVLFRIMGPPM